MSWREAVTVQPTTEPVTLDDAKVAARVDLTYTDEDSFITSLIVSARRVCETILKTAFIYRTILYRADNYPAGGGYFNRATRAMGPGMGWLPTNNFPVHIPTSPLASIVSIQYLDSTGVLQTLDPSLYVVGDGTPARIIPAYGKIWPTTLNMIDAVRITYVAGLGPDATTTPENVKTAIKMLVALYYQNRETIGSIPEGIKRMLDPEDPGYYS